MKVTVQVEIEREIHDQAAQRLAKQGLTIDEKIRFVLEQTAREAEPDHKELVPNTTTIAAIEEARRGELVELGTPAEALAELNSDD